MREVKMDQHDGVRDVSTRRNVALLDRKSLEDKCLQSMEEISLLKKHSILQEDKMRKMATKLLKLSSSYKERGSGFRDIETEEMIESLQSRIRSMEADNSSLKNKVMVLRMQLETPKKRDRYEHVPPKISSGSKKKPVAVSKVVARDAQLQYGHSLLTDARKDNLYLEGLVLEMRGQINCLQAKLDEDRADCATREKALVQENKNLQEKFLSVVEEQEKGAIVEDVDKIRLIRELRDKSSTVVALQTQIEGLERQLTTAHLQNVKLLEEMERVNGRAKDELTTRMVSEGLHNNSQVSTKAFAELREMVSDLRQEKDLLKLANERLLQSSLDDSRVTSIQRELHTWQERVASLEEQLIIEKSKTAQVCETLSTAKVASDSLQSETAMLKAELHAARRDHRELEGKFALLSKNGLLSWEAIQEAVEFFQLHKEEDFSQTKSLTIKDRQSGQFPMSVSPTCSQTSPTEEVTHHTLPNQTSVVKALRSELEKRLNQVHNLQEKLLFYEKLVAQHSEEVTRLKGLADLSCSQSQLVDASVQSPSVYTVSSSTQTTGLCTESVAVQVCWQSADAAVQTDGSTEGLGQLNRTLYNPFQLHSAAVVSEKEKKYMTSSMAITGTQADVPTDTPGPMGTQINTPTNAPVTDSEVSDFSEDNVVMGHFTPLHKERRELAGPHTLAISILSLIIHPESSVAQNPQISQLFVEYEFLNFDMNDLETPMSLCKPTNGQKIIFNFRQAFSFHPTLDAENCHDLKIAMRAMDKCSPLITFNIVCDPEDAEAECYEVGTAVLTVEQVLQGQDGVHRLLPVTGVDSSAKEVIGQLEISLDGLSLINAL